MYKKEKCGSLTRKGRFIYGMFCVVLNQYRFIIITQY